MGAEYQGKKIGNCAYSDMTVFSFHPVKSIATGEGGAVLTNNEDFYQKLLMFRHHGVTKDADKFKQEKQGDWYYEMQYLGYNYRLTDIHCALGISQLKKLDKFIQRRREIAGIYQEAFKGNAYFDLPVEKENCKSSWHLYPIRLKDGSKRRDVFASLRNNDLGVQVHYMPVHCHPYYQSLGYKQGLCPKAEDFYQRQISLPLYVSMTDKDADTVVNSVLKVFKECYG